MVKLWKNGMVEESGIMEGWNNGKMGDSRN
jgi:hypothetical protein